MASVPRFVKALLIVIIAAGLVWVSMFPKASPEQDVAWGIKRAFGKVSFKNANSFDWQPPIKITLDARTQWGFAYVHEEAIKAGGEIEVPLGSFRKNGAQYDPTDPSSAGEIDVPGFATVRSTLPPVGRLWEPSTPFTPFPKTP